MKFDRIAVVGISASGKSTFARALAKRAGLPLLYGDRLEWLPNWVVRPKEELDELHRTWIEQPRWIIEGWIDAERADRLNAANIVVDLDYSRWRCAWHLLARMLRGEKREEMPDGCVDRYSVGRLSVVFWKKERPAIDGALAVAKIRNYVRLKSPREAAAWLEKF